MQQPKTNFFEKLLSGLAHLVMLAGVSHLVMNLIGWPIFPIGTYYFLLPNLGLALIALFFSRFVLAHVLQAVGLHVAALGLGAVPAVLRYLVAVGILGERWQYTGWGGYGFTPVWALMTMIIMFSAIFIFSVSCEAAVRGFTGTTFTYPLVGRLVSRLSRT